jgi:DNA-binding PadR family transcriptional regulator
MYYELIILGRLMYAPYHGYLIMHVMSEMIGPWQKVSAGTLYPLLARLERQGLIQAQPLSDQSPPHRRTARTYAITNAGRARFHQLMLDIASSIGEYQRLFHLKVPHLEFLTRDEQLHVLEHYRDYCRAAIRHQDRVTRELEGRIGAAILPSSSETALVTRQGIEHGLATTRHMIAQWCAELSWVEQLLEHVPARR